MSQTQEDAQYITIVSGLPRSGTSMMMQMLHAGGMPTLADGERVADIDNPHGYFEFERVKKVKEDRTWLPEAQGKAVKMVYKLLYDLPQDYRYRVLLMRRRLEEVIKSQTKMLQRQGKDLGKLDEQTLLRIFEKHLEQVRAYMTVRPEFDYIEVDYNLMLTAPQAQVEKINLFLDRRLNPQAMLAVLDPTLHRNRSHA